MDDFPLGRLPKELGLALSCCCPETEIWTVWYYHPLPLCGALAAEQRKLLISFSHIWTKGNNMCPLFHFATSLENITIWVTFRDGTLAMGTSCYILSQPLTPSNRLWRRPRGSITLRRTQKARLTEDIFLAGSRKVTGCTSFRAWVLGRKHNISQ